MTKGPCLRINTCLEEIGTYPHKQANGVFASRMSDLIIRAFKHPGQQGQELLLALWESDGQG